MNSEKASKQLPSDINNNYSSHMVSIIELGCQIVVVRWSATFAVQIKWWCVEKR
jgi:hypothetical protein